MRILTLKKSFLYLILLSISITSISFAQNKKKQNESIDRYEEMVNSPNIYDPEPLEYNYGFTDEGIQIMKDKDIKRIPELEEGLTFPYQPEGVSPAKFQPFEITDPNFTMGNIPVCIIGTDELSQKWLEIRKDDLYDNMITCLIIEAQSKKDIDKLQNIAPFVYFNAMDGSWLQYIYIKNYPAIIQGNKVFQ